MTPRGAGIWAYRAIFALACVGLTLLQACTLVRPETDTAAQATSESELSPAAAATLTAWPSPPPIVTLPPTLTPAPRPLWTSLPLEETPFSAAILTPGVPTPAGSLPPPVRILIPALDVDVPVIEVGWTISRQDGAWHSEWETADYAAGHLRGSSNPGEAGNMVIAGHHNTKGEVFRPLSDVGLPGCPLRQGDAIIVVAEDGREYTYQVALWDRFLEDTVSREEVERHAGYLEPRDVATLTLVTCWPYDSNTHRVVVVALLVP